MSDVVLIREPLMEIVAVGDPGLPAATPAVRASVAILAGETIPALRVVRQHDDMVYLADAQVADHAAEVIGVSTHAAEAGQPVDVLLYGVLHEPGWPAGDLYCGTSGQLVSTPHEAAAWWMRVGRALGHVIHIQLEPPILM